MSSTRLPGKALLQIGDKTVLEWVIQRCQRSNNLEEIILATTEEKDDDPVAAIGEEFNIPVIRGNKENVLQRYIDVISQYPSEGVIRVTADNPLTDATIIDQVVEHFHTNMLDYCYAAKIPYGTGVDVFRSRILHEAINGTSQSRHLEHINTYFLDNHLYYQIGSVSVSSELWRPDVRVTLDTKQDYYCLQKIFKAIENPLTCHLAEIIEAYDALPIDLKSMS